LTAFLDQASMAENDLVSVIGLDGFTRARREGDVLSSGQDVRGTLVMRMQQRNPNITYLGPSVLDGIVRYFSHRRIPKYNLFVTSGISQADLLRPVERRANSYIVGAAIVSIAALLTAWLLVQLLHRRAEREAETAGANRLLEEAQSLARLGKWTFDPKSSEFFWSDLLAAMYERPPSQGPVSLNEFKNIFGEPGLVRFQTALNCLQSAGDQQEFELAARLPSGVISHRNIVAIADFDPNGRLVSVRGTDQDISSRKQVESLQQQVSHLARVDGINAVASTLAHELAQPLSAAANYSATGMILLAQPERRDEGAIVRAFEATQTQIQNAGEIIRRVRNLVVNREAQLEVVNLNEVIASAIALANGARPGCTAIILSQSTDEPPLAFADAVQLQQVLVNLILNARDASRPREPKITIETRLESPRLREVRVTDDGPGIPDDGRDVFSAFTGSSTDGLGLGLAISQTLVEAMKGTIRIAETGPHGTSICFTLLNATSQTVTPPIISRIPPP